MCLFRLEDILALMHTSDHPPTSMQGQHGCFLIGEDAPRPTRLQLTPLQIERYQRILEAPLGSPLLEMSPGHHCPPFAPRLADVASRWPQRDDSAPPGDPYNPDAMVQEVTQLLRDAAALARGPPASRSPPMESPPPPWHATLREFVRTWAKILPEYGSHLPAPPHLVRVPEHLRRQSHTVVSMLRDVGGALAPPPTEPATGAAWYSWAHGPTGAQQAALTILASHCPHWVWNPADRTWYSTPPPMPPPVLGTPRQILRGTAGGGMMALRDDQPIGLPSGKNPWLVNSRRLMELVLKRQQALSANKTKQASAGQGGNAWVFPAVIAKTLLQQRQGSTDEGDVELRPDSAAVHAALQVTLTTLRQAAGSVAASLSPATDWTSLITARGPCKTAVDDVHASYGQPSSQAETIAALAGSSMDTHQQSLSFLGYSYCAATEAEYRDKAVTQALRIVTSPSSDSVLPSVQPTAPTSHWPLPDSAALLASAHPTSVAEPIWVVTSRLDHPPATSLRARGKVCLSVEYRAVAAWIAPGEQYMALLAQDATLTVFTMGRREPSPTQGPPAPGCFINNVAVASVSRSALAIITAEGPVPASVVQVVDIAPPKDRTLSPTLRDRCSLAPRGQPLLVSIWQPPGGETVVGARAQVAVACVGQGARPSNRIEVWLLPAVKRSRDAQDPPQAPPGPAEISLKDPSFRPTSLAWHPRGTHLLALGITRDAQLPATECRLYALTTEGTLSLSKCRDFDGPVNCTSCTWTPNAELLVMSSEGTPSYWHLRDTPPGPPTWQPLQVVGPPPDMGPLQLSPGGGLSSCAPVTLDGQAVRAWHPSSHIAYEVEGLRVVTRLWRAWAEAHAREVALVERLATDWVQKLRSAWALPSRACAPELTTAWQACFAPLSLTELRAEVTAMPSNTTGGPLGTTRAHFLHAPDVALEPARLIINSILEGQSPPILKAGVFAPLEKDDSRYRALTLLDVMYKCAMSTVARRMLHLLQHF
mmetsp:Transcript_32542/g.83174  ORF Transcript_32542/g.83174 Transcript_32542/m.83174 type:complete len:991 (+) Transcript_32542:1261-4233(+)